MRTPSYERILIAKYEQVRVYWTYE